MGDVGGKNNIAIRVSNLSKCYHLYDTPRDRLKQFVIPKLCRAIPALRRFSHAPHSTSTTFYKEFWALRDVSFDVRQGEVVGIIGRNGAGKSTLLQILCGTLTPTIGEVAVRGRIAALLELGAGFNPEFTGRENVLMNAAIMGLNKEEIAARFEDIVEFSGIRDFIDQPVNTYSSGMYVRLAFSVAISVDPDILIIDEALSVGDGLFARKSFDRIMALKDDGKTILFCSHSLYQVEALCDRVFWLDSGCWRGGGSPADMVREYGAFLDGLEMSSALAQDIGQPVVVAKISEPEVGVQARITNVKIFVDGEVGRQAESGVSTVTVRVDFAVKGSGTPSVAVGLCTMDGRCVTSIGTANDGVVLSKDDSGCGVVIVHFERISLLKGIYRVDVWLLCERALFAYEWGQGVGTIEVTQTGLAQGIVNLPHRWEIA